MTRHQLARLFKATYRALWDVAALGNVLGGLLVGDTHSLGLDHLAAGGLLALEQSQEAKWRTRESSSCCHVNT